MGCSNVLRRQRKHSKTEEILPLFQRTAYTVFWTTQQIFLKNGACIIGNEITYLRAMRRYSGKNTYIIVKQYMFSNRAAEKHIA